jgi:predicted glycoside hydrolase/deacetylase ChbG (UPF0249 family)
MRWIRVPAIFVSFVYAGLLSLTPANAQQHSPSLLVRMGYPANARVLNIHADDFGMAHSVDRAIEKALENGWVDSASLMVPCPWYPEVLAWAKQHPNADLGIHLVLNSEWPGYRWGPISPRDQVASLLDPQGYFYNDPSLFGQVKLSQIDTELHAQIDKAQSDGITITHLDSHMIALLTTRHLLSIYEALSQAYGLPIPLTANGDYQIPAGATLPPDGLVLTDVVTMDPGIPARDWVHWYETTLAKLKPGIYQLIVHLAYDDAEMRGATQGHPDWGAAWRQRDFNMVQSQQFRQFLKQQGFILVTWRQLSRAYERRTPLTTPTAAPTHG